jgi:uncharacterized protein YlxW (UPF0749 family)
MEGREMTSKIELLPLYAELQGHPKAELIKHYARTNINHNTTLLQTEVKALQAEVEAYASRIERLEKMLSAYQTAVNKIDDLIEYSLPMPSETKAALYAVLAILTTTLAKEITND